MRVVGLPDQIGTEYLARLQERDLYRLAAELVAKELGVDLDDPAVTYRCWFEPDDHGSERVARVRISVARQAARA